MAQHMMKTQIIGGQTVVSGPGLITSDSTSSDADHSSESRSVSEAHNLRMQLSFEGFISKTMDIPDQYQKVTVKLISWCKELDDLKCEEEVQKLSNLFRDDFRFDVEHTLLNNAKPPQHQLNAAISNFVLNHDHPNNLLLIYYAGHGLFSENEKKLILAGSNGWVKSSATPVANTSHPYIANATWNTAEKALMDDAHGDVLVIFDCCYASDIQRSLGFGNKAFEMLAASNRNTTTPGPGPISFTGDLIKSLKELLEEREGNPFTTHDLLTKITPKRPIGLEPALHNRRFNIDVALQGRHILIAPHKTQLQTRPEDFLSYYPEASNLTLTFELGHRSLDGKQLERLAKNLPGVFKQAQIPLRRVHWRGIEARNSLRSTVVAIAGISTMRRHLDRVRKSKSRQQVATPSNRSERMEAAQWHQWRGFWQAFTERFQRAHCRVSATLTLKSLPSKKRSSVVDRTRMPR